MGMELGLGAGVPISGCCFMSLGPALRPALAAAKARSHSFNSERRVCECGVGFGSASAVVRAILVLPRLAWDGTIGLRRGRLAWDGAATWWITSGTRREVMSRVDRWANLLAKKHSIKPSCCHQARFATAVLHLGMASQAIRYAPSSVKNKPSRLLLLCHVKPNASTRREGITAVTQDRIDMCCCTGKGWRG